MGKKWKSYVYVPILASILFFAGIYLSNEQVLVIPEKNKQDQVYNLDEYFNKQETVVLDTRVVDEQSIILEQTTEDNIKAEPQFILKLENGFVVVYRVLDQSECYMVTGISVNDLPEITIEELRTGKEIFDEEALYFFLETHSS